MTRVAGSEDVPVRPNPRVPAVANVRSDPAAGTTRTAEDHSIRRSAAALLLIAVVGAFAFAAFRDGLTYPLQPPPGAAVLGDATSGPEPSPSVVPSDTASVTPSAPASLPAPPLSTPAPPSFEPTASPRATPQPRPSSDRYAVIEPCPDRDGCWIYTIRPGDNLFSIAKWFGVPLDVLRAWNPWTRTQGIDPGRHLRLPTPTR